jgi:predicted secreted protein
VLFAVLPFGVRSQAEDGEVTDGTDPGAPVLPGLAKKALITSVIAALVFAVVWYVWAEFDL